MPQNPLCSQLAVTVATLKHRKEERNEEVGKLYLCIGVRQEGKVCGRYGGEIFFKATKRRFGCGAFGHRLCLPPCSR